MFPIVRDYYSRASMVRQFVDFCLVQLWAGCSRLQAIQTVSMPIGSNDLRTILLRAWFQLISLMVRLEYCSLLPVFRGCWPRASLLADARPATDGQTWAQLCGEMPRSKAAASYATPNSSCN
jgi:hypothetical protein